MAVNILVFESMEGKNSGITDMLDFASAGSENHRHNNA